METTTHTHESSQSSTCENTRSVLDLPDIFMISVFRKFSLKELLKCACVCKKWNQLVRDGSLWRRIDLSQYKSTLTLGDVEKLVSVYATDATRYVSLVGNYVEDASSTNVVVCEEEQEEESNRRRRLSSFPFTHIDERFVTHALASRARALTHLSLSHIDVSTIDFDTLVRFTRLDTLSLAWCNLNPHWFRGGSSSTSLLDLKHFFLIRCCGISLDSDDITRVCSTAPGLRTLCINQSQSSLDDTSVDTIVAHLHALENLSLNNTLITDAAVERICASEHMCAHLKTLNLARSSSLSNRCLEPIGACLSNLKSLHLTSCFGISNAVALANFAQLSYLNLNNTSIEKEKIRELLVPALAQCEIEFGHEKMLNRKLMWTINGSRNCVCSF